MKKIYKIILMVAFLLTTVFFGFKADAVSPCGVSMGCTGVISITGIPYGTGTSPLGIVTIGSGLSFTGGTLSSTVAPMVYPGAGIPLSTGSSWGTSITNNSSNWNTAYTERLSSLTTTGSSGSATLISNVLNVPTYTLAGLGGQPSSTNLTSLSGLTYSSTSFVKMTASGTFSLDTNTYLTSLSGALLATGATTGATSQSQVFTNGITLSNLTASKVVFTDASKNLTSTGIGTSSQFIKGDGSLDSNTYLTTGTASSTYVPYTGASTTVNLGSNNLYSDGLVGIGTTSPSAKLHLYRPATDGTNEMLTIQNLLDTSSAYTRIRYIGTGSNWTAGVGNQNETSYGIANKFYIYDATNSKVGMSITPNTLAVNFPGAVTSNGLTLSNITGSVQCLQINASGVISGTGDDCGGAGASLIVGSTLISSGTDGKILYDNAGTLGEKSVSGTGDVVLTTSPTLITPTLGAASATSLTTTGSIELGNASDTTLSRVSAGVVSIEGVNITTDSSTSTLTNKRITQRITTEASSATPSINTDNTDLFSLTAQTQNITSFTTNLTGTPNNGDSLKIRIKPTNNTTNAITYVGSSVYDSATFGSPTVSLPTGTAVGDLMIAFVSTQSASSGPSNWTLTATNTAGTPVYLYTKVATELDILLKTVSFPGPGTRGRVTIVTYRGGFNKLNPIDVVSNSNYNVDNTTVRAASFNVTKPYSPILFFGYVYYPDEIKTFTPPSTPASFTENYDGGTTNSDMYHSVDMLLWSSSGSTGNIDSTFSGGGITTKHAFAISLNPAISVTHGTSFVKNYYTQNLIDSVAVDSVANEEFIYDSVLGKWVLSDIW